MTKESLSDKIQIVIYKDMKINGFDNKGEGWKGVGLSISDVKEKIQNAQRRLKKFKSKDTETLEFDYIVIPMKAFNEIFLEEFGEKLI